MNVSLYQAAAALNAHERWQEVITDNLAAGSIPGYKKQELSFATVESGLMPRSSTSVPQHFTLPRAVAGVNFLQGELHPSSGKTDVALDGPGFFAVQMPNGSTAYTRDGGFELSAQGQLVTKQGYAVLGDSGPIRLDTTNSGPLSISTSGEISQGSDIKGRLRVVGFSQPQLLTPAGAGFYVAQRPGLLPETIAQPNVRQGFLEASNAVGVLEMGNMMNVLRGFEANQRVIQMHDERMGKAISELGNPS